MKISVCIPTFNQAQYLSQAVRSAYNQSLKPIEIIVSNDCSTDNTSEILQMLSLEIPVLKIITQAENTGIVRNSDDCLRAGTGDFIVTVDSDDYLAPTYLEKLSGSLVKHPDACYAHCDVREVDQNGNFLKIRRLFRKPGFQSGESALEGAVQGYRVAANIIMFRRTDLVKLNYFTGRPDCIQDTHLAADIAASGFGNVYVNETLAFYRIWLDAAKTRQRRKLLEFIGYRKLMEEILEPAFKAKGWDLKKINNGRTSFACAQADCLSWDVYTTQEKDELHDALQKISSSPKAKMYYWLYRNRFGSLINLKRNIVGRLKTRLKAILLNKKISIGDVA